MTNKKGMIWQYLIGGIIALFVVILILIIFSKGSGKAYDELNDRILGVGDCDGDLVSNLYDKCPCDYANEDDGCPKNQEPRKCGENGAPKKEDICKE